MAIDSIPASLKAFSLFVDGAGYAGKINEIELPTPHHRHGRAPQCSMDMPIMLDMGMEAMEASFTMSEYNADLMKLFGVPGVAAFPITVRGALRRESATDVTPVEVRMLGNWTEWEPGNWKAGDKTEPGYTASLSYFKYEQAGVVLVEIDARNMVRKIGGVDQLDATRQALGV